MISPDPKYRISMASDLQDLRASQQLRYDVFVTELGGHGPLVDHELQLECDQYDPFSDHMLLHDDAIGAVVGVYRLMRASAADQAGQFYSETEYDLSTLRASGRRLLELGRSCVHPSYRGGAAMYYLWNGLAKYVADHQIDLVFGVASFHGTDIEALAGPLSLLHHRHLAPPSIRPRAHEGVFQTMDLIPANVLDRRAAMLQIPALIKAYLRLGGQVGEGAFVDHDFNTTDVCMVMDTHQMTARQTRIYQGRTEQ